jgi:hypothetical protein
VPRPTDINNELQKDVRLDPALEKQLCSAILERLDKDLSNDVQAISVKCLSVLVRRVAEPQVVDICSRLCRQVLSGREDMRDVYGIGLKTLIAEVPERSSLAVAENIAVPLTGGAEEGKTPEVGGGRGRAARWGAASCVAESWDSPSLRRDGGATPCALPSPPRRSAPSAWRC